MYSLAPSSEVGEGGGGVDPLVVIVVELHPLHLGLVLAHLGLEPLQPSWSSFTLSVQTRTVRVVFFAPMNMNMDDNHDDGLPAKTSDSLPLLKLLSRMTSSSVIDSTKSSRSPLSV